MSRTPNRMQRLVRLRQFREEVADNGLRAAKSTETRAAETHRGAVSEMEAIGAWKQHGNGGALDLAFYQVAIGVEAGAMERVDEAGQALASSETASARAGEVLVNAALSHRAAQKRSARVHRALAEAAEKREFDQMSDLNASRRGEKR